MSAPDLSPVPAHLAYNRALVELDALSQDLRGATITQEAQDQCRLRLEVAKEYISLGDSQLQAILVHKQRDESAS